MSIGDWDELFLPGVKAGKLLRSSQEAEALEEGGVPGSSQATEGEVAAVPRMHILRPIDGRLTYVRRGRNARKGKEEAIQEASVQLDSLSLHITSATPYRLRRSSYEKLKLVAACHVARHLP